MASDPFNIDMLYQTKANTTSWFMKNESADQDERFYIGSSTDGISPVGNGFWECNSNDQVRLNAQTPQTVDMDNSDGGCDMDFALAESKGHAGMTDAWLNVEMTARINLTSFSPSDGRFIMKGPTFHHHSNQVCCSGHAYGVRFFFGNPLVVQFFKEIWHVNYDSRDMVTTKYDSIKDGNDHVVKLVVYTKVVNGIEGRVLEAYIDDDGDGKDFVKVAETIDLGGWGSGGDECNGKDDQILSWGSGWMQYRWDGQTDLKFKDWSCREIDVNVSPETNPTDPIDTRDTESALVIPLVLSVDINALRVNPCATGAGGGGGSPENPFYDIAIFTSNVKELSNVSGFDNRKRCAARILGTAAPCYNKKPFSCLFPLAKVGSPNVASVFSKIWDSGNNVVYTSPTSFTDASLTTTLTYKTFDYSTNTRFLQVYDRIGVEYINADGSNYVITCYKSNRANSMEQSQYENTTWDNNNREQSCRLF